MSCTLYIDFLAYMYLLKRSHMTYKFNCYASIHFKTTSLQQHCGNVKTNFRYFTLTKRNWNETCLLDDNGSLGTEAEYYTNR